MKIFCIGRNYVEHAKELNNPVPKQPMVFIKPDTALLKENKPFYYPDFSTNVQYECEVVLKIGKVGKHIEPKFAHKYISQIGLGLDLTARDLQSELKEKRHPWEIAKGFDNSAVLGTFMPYEDWKDKDIAFKVTRGEETVQEGNTKDLIFDFDTLIAHISKFFTLKTGDLIYTGTPAGVGPLQIGETYRGFIEDQQIFEMEVR